MHCANMALSTAPSALARLTNRRKFANETMECDRWRLLAEVGFCSHTSFRSVVCGEGRAGGKSSLTHWSRNHKSLFYSVRLISVRHLLANIFTLFYICANRTRVPTARNNARNYRLWQPRFGVCYEAGAQIIDTAKATSRNERWYSTLKILTHVPP